MKKKVYGSEMRIIILLLIASTAFGHPEFLDAKRFERKHSEQVKLGKHSYYRTKNFKKGLKSCVVKEKYYIFDYRWDKNGNLTYIHIDKRTYVDGRSPTDCVMVWVDYKFRQTKHYINKHEATLFVLEDYLEIASRITTNWTELWKDPVEIIKRNEIYYLENRILEYRNIIMDCSVEGIMIVTPYANNYDSLKNVREIRKRSQLRD